MVDASRERSWQRGRDGRGQQHSLRRSVVEPGACLASAPHEVLCTPCLQDASQTPCSPSGTLDQQNMRLPISHRAWSQPVSRCFGRFLQVTPGRPGVDGCPVILSVAAYDRSRVARWRCNAAARCQQLLCLLHAQGTDTVASPSPPSAPAGLCWDDIPRLEGKQRPTGQMLTEQRLGFLNFSAAAGIAPGAPCTPLLHVLLLSCGTNKLAGLLMAICTGTSLRHVNVRALMCSCVHQSI